MRRHAPLRRLVGIGLALLLPVALYAGIAERNSWRPRTFSLGPLESPSWIFCSSDANRILVVDEPHRTATLWDTARARQVCAYTKRTVPELTSFTDAALAPDGSRWAIARSASPKSHGAGIAIIDVASNTMRRVGDSDRNYESLCYSRDGKFLAAAQNHILDFTSGRDQPFPSHLIDVFDTADGQLLRSLVTQSGAWPALAFSPDGNFLCAAGQSQNPSSVVEFHEAATGRLRRRFRTQDYAKSLAWYPNATEMIAVCDNTQLLQLWGVSDGARQHGLPLVLPTGNDVPGQIAMSRDGSMLAISAARPRSRVQGMDFCIMLQEGATRKPLRVIEWPGHEFACFAFRADGRHLIAASCDGTVADWRVR